MIIVRPMGGMGNQMYAYALGKSLSLRKNVPLLIDKSWVAEVGGRKKIDIYSLANFQLECQDWGLSQTPCFRPFFSSKADRVFSILSALMPKERKCILMEKECRYDAWIHDVKCETIYIRGGTWQSYRYFEDFESEIKNDFTFRRAVEDENKPLADRISGNQESVSVHIRRGDYVASEHCAYTQGICTARYYAGAIEYFKNRLSNPTFYFFSDDIAFVKEEFGDNDNFVFVDRRESRPNEVGYRDDGHNDMYLMSLCRHNIIANSTFSWWAAFLNRNQEKTVVAPGKWYQGVANDNFIVKPEWVRIDG